MFEYATTLGSVAVFDRDPVTGKRKIIIPADPPTPPDDDKTWELVSMAITFQDIYWSWRKPIP